MSSRTPSQNGAKLKPDTASGSSISRSNSSVSLDASMEFSSPSRPLSRSSSTLNVTLDLEPQQIVYPHTLSSVMNDPKVRFQENHKFALIYQPNAKKTKFTYYNNH